MGFATALIAILTLILMTISVATASLYHSWSISLDIHHASTCTSRAHSAGLRKRSGFIMPPLVPAPPTLLPCRWSEGDMARGVLPFIFQILLFLFCPLATAYDIIRDYSGSSFFDRWDYYGDIDNLTYGNVDYLDRQSAFDQHLTYTDTNGRAVIKVDNTSYVNSTGNRNSIRITTQDWYELGSLWVIDVTHLPYGCSTWPAFWSTGVDWPDNGEIDIIEAVNMMSNNQYALHTTEGCYLDSDSWQTGSIGPTNCSLGSGCVVGETAPNSYNSGFAAVGGGVYALQFDVAGIFIWFWSRPDVPTSVTHSTVTSSLDISQWGKPSASYPASTCNISEYFGPQQLIVDITLCGDWAGVPDTYNATCQNMGPTSLCYNDNVPGNGSNFDDAYFEISYIRTYTTMSAIPSATTEVNSGAQSTTSSSLTATASSNSARNCIGLDIGSEWGDIGLWSMRAWSVVVSVSLGVFGSAGLIIL